MVVLFGFFVFSHLESTVMWLQKIFFFPCAESFHTKSYFPGIMSRIICSQCDEETDTQASCGVGYNLHTWSEDIKQEESARQTPSL